MQDPIVWEKYGEFNLCDIQEPVEAKVKQLAIKHVKENLICQMMNYTQEENYIEDHNFFLDHIFHDQTSLIVMNENTEEIVAAVIMKTMTKDMRSWTAIRLVSKSRSVNSLLLITRTMMAEAAEQMNNPSGSMHIFEICAPKNNETDWTPMLFHGAFRVAQSMKMPVLTYVGFTLAEQAAALAFKFKEVARTFYPTFTDLDGHRPIPPSDIGESYAVLFCKEVPPFVPHDKLP